MIVKKYQQAFLAPLPGTSLTTPFLVIALRSVNKEEASDRVSPPLQDMEMQDPPRGEGAAQVVVEAREVPVIKVVRAQEVVDNVF